jgi:hypothetical protein
MRWRHKNLSKLFKPRQSIKAHRHQMLFPQWIRHQMKCRRPHHHRLVPVRFVTLLYILLVCVFENNGAAMMKEVNREEENNEGARRRVTFDVCFVEFVLFSIF